MNNWMGNAIRTLNKQKYYIGFTDCHNVAIKVADCVSLIRDGVLQYAHIVCLWQNEDSKVKMAKVRYFRMPHKVSSSLLNDPRYIEMEFKVLLDTV